LGEANRVPLELKATINLPKTAFPMKANLPQNEPKMLARWEQARIYERIREARKGSPTYILHDGPPYTSGPIHMGTALNKCLKDFIVKIEDHGWIRRALCAGMGLPRVADRNQSGQGVGGKKASKCVRWTCARNAASMHKSFWICSGSSSRGLECSGDLIVRMRR